MEGDPNDWVPKLQTDDNITHWVRRANLNILDPRSLAADYPANQVAVFDKAFPYSAGIVILTLDDNELSIISERLSKEECIVATDWLNKNVYWIDRDPAANHIAVVSSTNKRTQLVHTGLDSPMSLAVAPQFGYLFWIEAGNTPAVRRSGLRGQDVTTLVSTDVTHPVTLTLDHERRILYWLDDARGMVEAVDFEGANRRTVWADLLITVGSYGVIDIFQDFLFLLRGRSNLVDVVDMTTLTRVATVNYNTEEDEDVTSHGMSMLAPERQPLTSQENVCVTNSDVCEHICVQDSESAAATCLCDFGFVLQNSNCVSVGVEDNFLLMTDDSLTKSIYQLELTSGQVHAIPIPYLNSPYAIQYHPVEKMVYWSDLSDNTIRRIGLNGSQLEIVLQFSSQSSIYQMALDLSTDRLYYTDEGLQAVGYYDGTNQRTLVATGALSKPSGIALDVIERVMYWTDWGSPPRIERANMDDGSDRQEIVSTGIVKPFGIAIDFSRELLYWCDAKENKIERVNLDGSNRVLVLQETLDSHFFDVTLDDTYIYVIDWLKRYVRRVHRETMNTDTVGPTFFGTLNAILLVNSSFPNLGRANSTTTTPSEPALSQTTVIIIAVVVGGVVFITLIVTVGVCVVRKRRRSNMPPRQQERPGSKVPSVHGAVMSGDDVYLTTQSYQLPPPIYDEIRSDE